MRYQLLLNILTFLVGTALGTIGTLLLAIVVSGDVSRGRTGLTLSGIGLLLAAAPALAVPFSVRTAKALLLFALMCLAASAVWLTFWPQPGVAPTPLIQGAVIAFAVLLIVRVFLGWRGNSVGIGT